MCIYTSCIWLLLHLKFFFIILKLNVCSTLQTCTYLICLTPRYWAAGMHPYGKDTNLWSHLRAIMVEYYNSSWQLFGWHDVTRICDIWSQPVVLGLSCHTHPEVIATSRTGHCHNSFLHLMYLWNALGFINTLTANVKSQLGLGSTMNAIFKPYVVLL